MRPTLYEVSRASSYSTNTDSTIRNLISAVKFQVLTAASRKMAALRITAPCSLVDVLYGCETWSLTLTEEHRLRVFKNRVLRRIFGSKRDEVTGEWRKLHNEELHNLYSSPDIIRQVKANEVGGARSTHGRG
jgi:hypothetical protein